MYMLKRNFLIIFGVVFSLNVCSAQSLQTFTARMDEIASRGYSLEVDATYAGSTHSLQTFIARMDEIASRGYSLKVDAIYAGSTRSL